MALSPVFHPRRLVYEQTGRPYLRLYVCQLERYRLVLGDRLSERGSSQGVLRGVAERCFGDTGGLRGYPDSARVQSPERDAKSFSFHPQPVFFRDEDVIEEHVVRGGRDDTHLLRMLAEGDPFGVHSDDEGRNAFGGAGEEDHGPGDPSVRDPLLVPRDTVAALDAFGPRLDRGGVRSLLRLGEGEASDP